MSFRDGPLQDLKVPLSLAGAAALVIAAALGVFFLFGDRAPPPRSAVNAAVRNGFDRAVSPVAQVLAAPVRWAGEARTAVGGYFNAVDENRRLRGEASETQRLRDQVMALQNLNRRYETILGLRTEPPVPMVAARVVSDTHGPFSNARLIDVGSERGVKVGNPVIAERGVIGRLVGVAHGVSRVLMLTDPQSRTPVLVNSTNARAILTGDGTDAPRLVYLRGHNPVKTGDIILTSGDGGLYPRGLPVGVADQDGFGQWRVRLYSDTAPLDFVQVLKFEDFAQLAVNNAELDDRKLPPPSPAEAAQIKATLEARSNATPPKPAPVAAGAPPIKAVSGPVSSKPDATAKPVAAKPVAAKPVAARPADANPVPANPASAKPVQGKSLQGGSVQGKSVQGKSPQAKPDHASAEEAPR